MIMIVVVIKISTATPFFSSSFLAGRLTPGWPPHRPPNTTEKTTRVSRVLGFMFNRLRPSATPHSPWPTTAGGPASTTVLGVIESPLLAGVARAVGNPSPSKKEKIKKKGQDLNGNSKPQNLFGLWNY